MPFASIGLSDPLVKGILATGYEAPTEIQAQAIPAALEGKDLIACAQTGTGKTAAFVLPILDRLAHPSGKPKGKGKKRKVKALILTPTRELAEQIDQSVQNYGKFMPTNSMPVFGGVNMFHQTRKLQRGVDVVAATPGRLLDHIQRGTIDLRNVEVLVLDEADRMVDMGFINDIRKILAALPDNKQTLLFSATLSGDIKKLSKTLLRNPVTIQVGKVHNPVETITQHVYPMAKESKMPALIHLIEQPHVSSVLVFSKTRRNADKLTRRLAKEGVGAVAIHAGRTQKQRQRAIADFKSGRFSVMIATDVAARGIDISGISHVINYDIPAYPEDYVHRIGRTGRAQAEGCAITFVAPEDMKYLKKIERFIEKPLPLEQYEEFTLEIAPAKQGQGKGKGKGSGKPKKKGPKKGPKEGATDELAVRFRKPRRRKIKGPVRKGEPTPPDTRKPTGGKAEADRGSGKPSARPGGRPGGRSSGKPSGKPGGRPGGRPGGKPGSKKRFTSKTSGGRKPKR